MPNPQLEQIASKFELSIQKALLDAFKALRAYYTETRILGALETYGIGGVLALLDSIEDTVRANISTSLQSAYMESGRMLLTFLPVGALSSNYVFSPFEYGASAAFQEYQIAMVQSIGESTRLSIMQSIQQNYIAGNPPAKMARDFRSSLGLNQQQELAAQNFERMLREGDKQALTRELRDRRFDPSVVRLIQGEEISESKIQQMVQRYRERLLIYRSKTIARTESLRMLSMGEFEGIRQAEESGNLHPGIKRFWIHAGDEKVRASHNAIPGLNKDGVGPTEPFQTPLGPLRYPRDPRGSASNVINCRCSTRYRLDRSTAGTDEFESRDDVKPILEEAG